MPNLSSPTWFISHLFSFQNFSSDFQVLTNSLCQVWEIAGLSGHMTELLLMLNWSILSHWCWPNLPTLSIRLVMTIWYCHCVGWSKKRCSFRQASGIHECASKNIFKLVPAGNRLVNKLMHYWMKNSLFLQHNFGCEHNLDLLNDIICLQELGSCPASTGQFRLLWAYSFGSLDIVFHDHFYSGCSKSDHATYLPEIKPGVGR